MQYALLPNSHVVYINIHCGVIGWTTINDQKAVSWGRASLRLIVAKFPVAARYSLKDVVTPYTHISEASRYILYTIILTFDGICTIS